MERCLLANTNESMEDVVKYVIKSLAANDRTNPQDLDRAVVGFLQDVINAKDIPHTEVVPQKFANNWCNLINTRYYN